MKDVSLEFRMQSKDRIAHATENGAHNGFLRLLYIVFWGGFFFLGRRGVVLVGFHLVESFSFLIPLKNS